MKKIKRTLAMALAATVALNANVFASSTWGGSEYDATSASGVTAGQSTLVKPIISIVLPTSYDFKLDPFERTTSTIYSGNGFAAGYGFPMVNKSNVDLQVTVNLAVLPTDSSVKVVAPTALKQNDTAYTNKDFYMYAVPFKTQTGITTTAHSGFNKATYATAQDSMVFLTTGSGLSANASEYTSWSSLEFKLKAATYNADQTQFASQDIAAGVSGFTLYGKLNSQANWADNDITLLKVYSLTPLTPAIYSGITLKTDGMNLTATTPSKDVAAQGFLPTLDAPTVTTAIGASADGVYTFSDAYTKGLSVVGVKVTTVKDNKSTVVFNAKPATPYTYTAATSSTVPAKLTVSKSAYPTLVTAANSYTIEAQLSNGIWMTVDNVTNP